MGKDAEVRHAEDLSARFCIVDEKDLMFMVMNDEEVHPTYDVGVWVQTPYFASTVQGMFDHQWEKMSPASKMLK